MTEASRAKLSIERIDDLHDPRVADYRELRDRDLAARREAFMAESEVVLRVLAARGRYPVRSVLLTDSRLEKVADALAVLPPGVPIYLAAQRVMNEVVGFPIHRGILASCERTPLETPAALLAGLGPGRARIVIAEALKNHDNVGGVFRNAAAFGAAAVLIDHATCDPLYRKAIRVSVGAALFVPFARAPSCLELVSAAQGAGFHCLALSPRLDAQALDTLATAPARVALVVGTEGAGLSDAVMRQCDGLVRIAMAPGFDSLNVATSAGIALHQVFTLQRAGADPAGH